MLLVKLYKKYKTCRKKWTIEISNIKNRGCVLVSITKNAGIGYGLYAIWFNAGSIIKTSEISGNNGLNSASLSEGVLTLKTEKWSIGFYLLYSED